MWQKFANFFKKVLRKITKKGFKGWKQGLGGGAFVFLWNFLGLCLGLGNFFGFVEFLGFVWNVLGNFLGICLIFFKILGRFWICLEILKFVEKIWIFGAILKNLVILSVATQRVARRKPQQKNPQTEPKRLSFYASNAVFFRQKTRKNLYLKCEKAFQARVFSLPLTKNLL